ncbi:MAG: SusC/RagA family TonB-linked outer membrane protein [Gemmatimonadaceae bacterium]
MRSRKPRRFVTSAMVAALMALTAASAAAQGTITGTVTSQSTGAALQEVRVMILGTSIFTVTAADGKYTLRRVPAGTAEVRVLRVGHTEQKKSVRVIDGQTATLDFAMPVALVTLQEVVTTATGEQRRVEIGNAVSNIPVGDLTKDGSVHNISDVLNSRVPGVQVQSGTQTGTGARIRIRGVSSISLANDPIYIIDGVRMSANIGSITFSSGGGNPSRLNDLSPEEIENIEIVKGPSAATLYGTDAANGVVVITTKRGRAGAAKWTAFAEGGLLRDTHTYPTNYTLQGHAPSGTALSNPGSCTLPLISSGACVLDSLRTMNLMSDWQCTDITSSKAQTCQRDLGVTPLSDGNRQLFGLQLSGGSEVIKYFLSADHENEIGVFALPRFERTRYDSLGITPHEWTERPNTLGKNAFRMNVNAAVTPQLDLAINMGYVNLAQRYSQESNATAGIGSQAFGGPGYITNGTVSGTGTPLMGYRAWTPAYTWEEKRDQGIHRFIGSANAIWRPTSWLTNRANVGTDLTDRNDHDLRFRGETPPLNATYRLGFAGNGRTNIRNLTVDLGSTANYNPSKFTWMNLKTTGGIQYNNYQLDQNTASGTDIPPGAQTPGSAASPSADEATTLQRTLGFFAEQAMSVRDRLFLTVAVRSDQNSAFGTNFQRVYYPKVSASWIVSDEEFFPKLSFLNNLRIRSAYGSSGVQPGPNDASRLFQAITTSVKGVDTPGEQYSDIGNANLKPERSTEIEAGFESRWFNNRATLEINYYKRTTQDALISAIVAPSQGSAATVRTNLGSIQNKGWEMLLTSQVVDRPQLGFDITFSGSTNDNTVKDLGGTLPQKGVSNWIIEGYPIRGLWARSIDGWDDKNKDGILTYSANSALNEVFVSKDTTFQGYNQPRYVLAVTPGVELFKHRLRVQSLFDYRGGFRYYNNTERIRCVSRQNCNGRMNPEASFEEQAMVVATLDDPSHTIAGFFQDGSFVKWRELSVTATMPERLAAKAGARTASLTFAGRNLKLWTRYRGTDPESDYQVTDGVDTPNEFQTFAAPTYFVFRVNLGF